MQGRVKITKRQIKEDHFTTFMLTARDRFFENWVPVTVGALAVVVAIVAVVFYANSREASAREAADRYAQAMTEYRSGNRDAAMISLQNMIDEYAGGNVAEQATYVLGRMYLLDRNYPEAMRYYQLFIDNFKDSHLHRAASFGGLAICHENQGESALAAAKFEEAIAADPDGPNVGDYHLGALRNYLTAGDEASARIKVDALQADFAGSQWEQTGLRLFYESGFQP